MSLVPLPQKSFLFLFLKLRKLRFLRVTDISFLLFAAMNIAMFVHNFTQAQANAPAPAAAIAPASPTRPRARLPKGASEVRPVRFPDADGETDSAHFLLRGADVVSTLHRMAA